MEYCPISGGLCMNDCAWRLGNECAMVYIGKELYNAVETIQLAAHLQAENPAPLPPGAVVVKGKK